MFNMATSKLARDLPPLDRRSLICALGTAAIAGIPAAAGAAPVGDPVIQALAELERLKTHAEVANAADAAVEEAMPDISVSVTLDGKRIRTHEEIDAHFRPVFEDEEEFNGMVERIEKLRPRLLSDGERAERDRARQAAHDELAGKEMEHAEARRALNADEIEARKNEGDTAVWDAEYAVMDSTPATTAGAISLLRFSADLLEEFCHSEESEHSIQAMRNTADFLARGNA
jgi:hypothetical protein